jgi:hypothetical protein
MLAKRKRSDPTHLVTVVPVLTFSILLRNSEMVLAEDESGR